MPLIRDWVSTTRPQIATGSPKSAHGDKSWGAAILLLKAERSVPVAAAALRDGRPAAIFMPADLVHRIAQLQDDTYDTALARTVKDCTKIHFAQPGHM